MCPTYAIAASSHMSWKWQISLVFIDDSGDILSSLILVLCGLYDRSLIRIFRGVFLSILGINLIRIDFDRFPCIE